MTMFALGYSAKLYGLNLSDSDITNRYRSVEYCKQFIDFSAEMDTGIILGLIQGSPTQDKGPARSCFCASLDLLALYAQKKGVPLLVEATNNSLTSIANTAEGTQSLIAPYSDSAHTIGMLLDTYHMAIEESDMIQVLSQHITDCISIHYSDNNRLFPGLGDLDFAEITACLKHARYQGLVVLEANIHTSLEKDLRTSLGYLSQIMV